MVQPVTVHYRGKQDELVVRGGRADGVIGFRWGFDEQGLQHEQLSFLLVNEGFLIAQPAGFDGGQQGWWYCDLVTVDDRGETVDIEDLYVDVLVGPPITAYRVLDLDELATAVATGVVPLDTALGGLERCQAFLDRRLNRRDDAEPTWPDFPPSEVRTELWQTLPIEWEWRRTTD